MLSATRESTTPPPARRTPRRAAPQVPAAPGRKRLQMLLAFVTLVLVINALVGERGLMESVRARRTHDNLAASIERMRGENERLREYIRRLLTDPAAIEALARQELGLIKPGEVLFIIKDARPAPAGRLTPALAE